MKMSLIIFMPSVEDGGIENLFYYHELYVN